MSNKLKTHYKTDDSNYAVCSTKKKFEKLTFKPSEVTCEHCKANAKWQEDISIEESKRVASGEELGEPFEVLKYELHSSGICMTFCDYTNLLVGSAACSKCLYSKGYNKENKTVNCSYKYDNKKEKIIVKYGDVIIFKYAKYMEVTGVNREQFNLLFDFFRKKDILFSHSTDETEFVIVNSDDFETVIDFIKQNFNDLNEAFPEKTWIESAVDENKDRISKSFDEMIKNIIDDCPQTKLNIKIQPPEYKPEDVAFKKKLPSKYHREYYSMSEGKSVVLDVYDKLAVMDLPNAEIEHTYKKLDRCGKGDKSLLEDLREARDQLDMGIKRIEKDLEV